MNCKLCDFQKAIKLKIIEINLLQRFYNFSIKKYLKKNSIELYQCLNCGLKFFENALPGDEAYYKELEKFDFYYEEDKNEFNYAISKILEVNPKKILEIGAGKGYFLEKIKDIFQVRAIEYNPNCIKVLKEKKIFLDQKKDKYDFICLFQVLEHVGNIKEFLSFIDSKLLKNGYLLISVPNNDSIYFKEVFDYLDYPPHHLYQFSKKALLYLAEFLSYKILDYWTEPLRIEHFKIIIKSRRKKIIKDMSANHNKWLSFFDNLLIPYFYNNNLLGHTHAIFLQK